MASRGNVLLVKADLDIVEVGLGVHPTRVILKPLRDGSVEVVSVKEGA